jgi:hypothetical protein
MAGWVLAAGGSNVDVVARVVGVVGLVVAIGSAVLTWYLWRRSGPEIVVLLKRIAGDPRGLKVEVEVINSGRMPVVIRDVQLRWTRRGGRSAARAAGALYVGHARSLDPASGQYPVTIEPTGFMLAVLIPFDEYDSGLEKMWGVAVRGDGRTYSSRPA